MKLGKELVLGLLGEAEEVDQDVRMDIVDDHVGDNMVLLRNNLKLDRCECEVGIGVVEVVVIQKKTEEDILHLDMCEWEVEVGREHWGMKAPMTLIQKTEGDSQNLDTCEWGVVGKVDSEEVEVGWVRTGMKGQMAVIQGPEGDIRDFEVEKEVGEESWLAEVVLLKQAKAEVLLAPCQGCSA